MNRIILFFSLLLVFRTQAQLADPVKWEFALSSSDLHVGDTVEIIAKATIETNWYLYSNDFDPTLGPVLTEFTFTSKEGYKLLGKTKAIHPKKKYDATFSGNITYFVEHAEFKQKIILLTQKPVITFTVEYQACNDALGRCVPGETDYSFSDLIVKPSIKKAIPAAKTPVTKKSTPSSTAIPSISQLESEKKKLIQKDAKGNDVAVDYLKSFVKKYGK